MSGYYSEERRLRRDNIDRIYPERIAFFERWSRIWQRLVVVCVLLLVGVVVSGLAGAAWVATGLAVAGSTTVVVGLVLNVRGERRLPKPHDV
jgi:Flp pilus assembly protein TadB